MDQLELELDLELLSVTFQENITEIDSRVDDFAVDDNTLRPDVNANYNNLDTTLLPDDVFTATGVLHSQTLFMPNFDPVLSPRMEASPRFTELEIDANDSIQGTTGPFSIQISNHGDTRPDTEAQQTALQDPEGSIEIVKRRYVFHQ